MFIDEHKDEFGAERVCAALRELGAQIAPATYYAARPRGASARTVSDAGLIDRLRSLQPAPGKIAEPESLYGYRKMWHWLR